MEIVCKIAVGELYPNIPLTKLLKAGDDIFSLKVQVIPKYKLTYSKCKIKIVHDYGVATERIGGNGDTVTKVFVEKDCIFLERPVSI